MGLNTPDIRDATQLNKFLGMTNYYRKFFFAQNFAQINYKRKSNPMGNGATPLVPPMETRRDTFEWIADRVEGRC